MVECKVFYIKTDIKQLWVLNETINDTQNIWKYPEIQE